MCAVERASPNPPPAAAGAPGSPAVPVADHAAPANVNPSPIRGFFSRAFHRSPAAGNRASAAAQIREDMQQPPQQPNAIISDDDDGDQIEWANLDRRNNDQRMDRERREREQMQREREQLLREREQLQQNRDAADKNKSPSAARFAPLGNRGRAPGLYNPAAGQKNSPPQAPPIAGGGADGLQGDFWRCSSCTVANENILSQCMVCNTARPSEAEGGPALSSFTCGVCTFVSSDPVACEMCATKRAPGAKATPPKKGGGGGGDGESKESEEARHFVMGQEPPPPLKRQALVREHLAFLAGVEEAFGTIHVAPVLLQGIERLVRKPFEALLTQYAPPAHPLSPAAASAVVISPEILDTLLKALTYRACQRALHVHSKLELILSCCVAEEDELRELTCNKCGQSGSEIALHYSDQCGTGVRHTFCLRCTHEYVTGLVESKACAKVLCPFSSLAPPPAQLSNGGPVIDAPSMDCLTLHDESSGVQLVPTRCDKEVDVKWIRRALSLREFQAYLDECFAIMISGAGAGGGPAVGGLGGKPSEGSSYLHCPNASCRSIMEVMRPHGLVVPILIKEVDEQGKTLTPEAWLHFSEFRVRCHSCQTNFCSSCKTTPYHVGRSCDDHTKYLAAKHCRFCESALTPENTDPTNKIKAFENICTAELCLQRRENACEEMLGCGHACPGVRGEKEHVSCLLEECAKLDASLRVCSADLCSICWVEELGLAPVVKLSSCGHIFHAHCVVDKISKRWPGVRITFGFMDCSICKIPMDHASPLIQRVKKPLDDLFTQIKTKALARLSIEKMEKDPKLIDPQSRYYNQPLKYAIDCFAYYNCFKCGQFYFGGRRDCEQNAAAENRPVEEFVCYGCADLKSVQCKNAEHSEYLVWKCRFCCNLASWFCFGTTHYCEPCHSDNPMEKVRRKREGFKQCAGYQMCPTKKEKHAPNGAEAECEDCLGCGACQEELTKLQAAREKEKAVDAKVKEISHSSVQL